MQANRDEIDRCEDLIAGYSRAISRATFVDIDTVDEIRSEYHKNREDIRRQEEEIRSLTHEMEGIDRTIDSIYMDERNCTLYRYEGDSGVMAREYNTLKPHMYEQTQALQEEKVSIRRRVEALQQVIRDYEREADEGRYVDDRPLEDF